MKIPKLKEITIRELTEGYVNKDIEGGIVGYGGRLDIRPPYQRNFVYGDKQRDAVIDTVFKGFPLNVMYWAVRDDGGFEMIDGQQRTISIGEYVKNKFSTKIGDVSGYRSFKSLQDDEKEKILNYKIMIYFCEGTDSEKLKWFETINIAGEKLTPQELRNAIFSGPWVSDAKRYFSKTGCVAHKVGKKYLDKKLDRQEYLESAIKWINKGDINGYMNDHRQHPKADELWDYFRAVIKWVEVTFPVYREKEMNKVEWGFLYNKFKNKKLDSAKLEADVVKLMEDEDVSSKKGIYTYVLTGEEKHLNIRRFDDKQKREVYERQKGICPKCKKHFKIGGMEADHITPWSEGGKTDIENCQMLCKEDNRRKSNK